jgi:hypothetical protein
MNKWEYKIEILKSKEWFASRIDTINPETEQLLNTLGNDGWELVNASPMVLVGGFDTSTSHFILIFKRVINE